MKTLCLFNNKGGVGKTTLAFHLGYILAEKGKRVLMIDLDPQCNLTICAVKEDKLYEIWKEEDNFIDSFEDSQKRMSKEEYEKIISNSRSIHFLLKPTEEGISDLDTLPPPYHIREGLDIITGRLTLHQYESKIAERWSGAFLGDALSLRTISKINGVAKDYDAKYHYDFVIMDTSPSLGILNKVVVSTVDGFIIPCLPDMFSLYGIRNIGKALTEWQRQFKTLIKLVPAEKRKGFSEKFVQFLGYTIYNAKKYTKKTNNVWSLAKAHYNFAIQIPSTINEYIREEVREHLSGSMVDAPIGGTAVMHTHSTLPNMAQKYKNPVWIIPSLPDLDSDDARTIKGNRGDYEKTKDGYMAFADDLLERLKTLDR